MIRTSNEIHYINEIIEKVKMTNRETQENLIRRAVQRLRNKN